MDNKIGSPITAVHINNKKNIGKKILKKENETIPPNDFLSNISELAFLLKI